MSFLEKCLWRSFLYFLIGLSFCCTRVLLLLSYKCSLYILATSPLLNLGFTKMFFPLNWVFHFLVFLILMTFLLSIFFLRVYILSTYVMSLIHFVLKFLYVVWCRYLLILLHVILVVWFTLSLMNNFAGYRINSWLTIYILYCDALKLFFCP